MVYFTLFTSLFPFVFFYSCLNAWLWSKLHRQYSWRELPFVRCTDQKKKKMLMIAKGGLATSWWVMMFWSRECKTLGAQCKLDWSGVVCHENRFPFFEAGYGYRFLLIFLLVFNFFLFFCRRAWPHSNAASANQCVTFWGNTSPNKRQRNRGRSSKRAVFMALVPYAQDSYFHSILSTLYICAITASAFFFSLLCVCNPTSTGCWIFSMGGKLSQRVL